jgi:hypothetical protein
MKILIPFAFVFVIAGTVKSQAPVTDINGMATSLQTIVTANKDTIDKQSKTLDVLDQLDQDAQQLKTFTKRS